MDPQPPNTTVLGRPLLGAALYQGREEEGEVDRGVGDILGMDKVDGKVDDQRRGDTITIGECSISLFLSPLPAPSPSIQYPPISLDLSKKTVFRDIPNQP